MKKGFFKKTIFPAVLCAKQHFVSFISFVVERLKKTSKTYTRATVTKGYKLTINETLTGSKLDDPVINQLEILIYKVNGHWVSEQAITFSLSL